MPKLPPPNLLRPQAVWKPKRSWLYSRRRRNGAGASGPIILDNFTGTNGTALSAHTVSPTNTPGGSWDVLGYTIVNNRAVNSSTPSYEAAGIPTGKTDLYRVTLTLTSIGDGPALRVQDNTHNFFAQYDGAKLALYENNGGLTLRASQTFTASGVEKISIELSGNLITAKHYSDGVLDGTVTYTSALFAASQKAGISLFSGHAADDFTVEAI